MNSFLADGSIERQAIHIGTMAEIDQQDSQDALNNGSDNNSECDDQCDASMAEESHSNGMKK